MTTERERLSDILDAKIDTIIQNAASLSISAHMMLSLIQNGLESEGKEMHLPLLRVYVKYLSERYTSIVIQHVVLALHNHMVLPQEADWSKVPDSVYEAVTARHFEAFITVSKKCAEYRAGRVAVRYPDKQEQICMLRQRGIVDEQELDDAVREMDFGTSQILRDGAL